MPGGVVMPDPLFPDAAFHARIRELEAGRDRLAADKVRLLLRAAKLETALIEAVALIGETSLDLLPEAAEVIQRWRELLGPATQTYPGRTDETERAFEGDTMPNVDGEQIIGHLIDRHRRNYPDVDHISPPTPNPHNRSEEETQRWRAYNLGRLHAFIEALNAIRTAAAGKDIGP